MTTNGLRGQNRLFSCLASLLISIALLLSQPKTLLAQSFFSSLIADPTTGVDRGSASVVKRVEDRSTFVTFDTYGARDIGRAVSGIGFALPNSFVARDQFDIVGLVAGPSDTGGLELVAGGVAYRIPIGATGREAFFNVDYADYTLGTKSSLALDVEGNRMNAALGVKQVWTLSEDSKVTGSVEFIAREERASVLDMSVTDESLRLVRLGALYEKGRPFGIQGRLSGALTVGLDALGASPASNLRASAPGASSEFARFSFGAEASLPLSALLVLNAGIIGQWSNDSLPVSQRCGYGTNAYARGFDRGYANGDRCLGGRTEIAANLEFPSPAAEKFVFSQVYLGLDYGVVEDVGNAFVPGSTDVWSSASLGFRTIRGNIVAEASATHVLKDPGGFAPQGQNRFWLRTAFLF